MKRHHPLLSWPQVQEGHMKVACHLCDALQESPRLRDGEAAYCCECGERLYRNRPKSLAHATSFSSAGIIFMVLAHVFPMLTLTSGSMRTQLTLLDAVEKMALAGNFLLAISIVFFTIVAPAVLIGGLLYLAAPLRHGVALPGSLWVAWLYQRIEPWSMLEVFLLGLVVSLLKLAHMADMEFGIGMWALTGLVFCTAAAVGGIDRLELWDRLEVAHQEHPEAEPPPEVPHTGHRGEHQPV